MRARLIALGVLAVLLAAAVVVLAQTAAAFQAEGQSIGSSGALSEASARREQFVFVLAFVLQTLIAPVAAASGLAVVAILAVLARRAQLRRDRAGRGRLRPPAPAR